MAKIVLIGLEPAAAANLPRTCRRSPPDRAATADTLIRKLGNADIVFAGGEPSHYMPLLKRVRKERPALPFVVVTRIAETNEWLDAIEAGATDYCSVPIEKRQLHWLIESTRPWPRAATPDPSKPVNS
jgi:DNA-binding NtrC family response regulator